MAESKGSISFELHPINSSLYTAKISVPARIVEALYNQIVLSIQHDAHIHGFPKGQAPLSYIESNYKSHILDHVKEFLFNHFVVHALYDNIHEKKILLAGEPRLESIEVEADKPAVYIFELSVAQPVELLKWKNLPFKAPARKNYKDIDRQVESFIKDEQEALEKATVDTIQIGDWVNFDIKLLNQSQQSIFAEDTENLWLKIGDEEADLPFQDLFVDRKKGDVFIATNLCLQDFFSNKVKTAFPFEVHVTDIVKNSYFCLGYFKKHFRLKTNKDVHRKLIEVFSYRNDFSLRRSMVEESLKLLINKHHLEAPNALVLRQQKAVLDMVVNNPDYQVFKTHPNFNDHVRKLAEKQAREMLMIDQIAVDENIPAQHDDIVGYVNLLKRPRTKEFVYFEIPNSKVNGQEKPLNNTLLQHYCRREKALNHVLYHLTKK